jgi:hypothetical protein
MKGWFVVKKGFLICMVFTVFACGNNATSINLEGEKEMTLSSTVSRVQYTGNGAVDEYDFPYLFHDEDDLVVIETTDEGVSTTLTKTTHYTVTGEGEAAGGAVTRVAGNLPTDYLWTIYREVDLKQEVDLSNQQAYFLETMETALDHVTMIAQQLQEQLDRTLQDDIVSAEGIDWDDVTDAVDDAETAATAAEAAQTAAEAAQTAAETAQTDAETAQTDAETAQGLAETAQTAAEDAAGDAETAQAAAEAAQGLAETAQTAAEAAKDDAETAQTAAEAAAAQPCFSVCTSANGTDVTGDGTWYTIPFDTVIYDDNLDFDTTNNWYVVPATGLYLLNFKLALAGFTTTHQYLKMQALVYDGSYTEYYFCPYLPIPDDWAGLIVNIEYNLLIPLVLNDHVILRCAVLSGTKVVDIRTGDFQSSSQATIISGVRVSP